MQIGFVNSSKRWVSRQPQLRLRLLRLAPMFRLDRWRLSQPATAGGDDRCHLLAVLEGQVGDTLSLLPLARAAGEPANAVDLVFERLHDGL
jgi:hypothetical protein